MKSVRFTLKADFWEVVEIVGYVLLAEISLHAVTETQWRGP